MDIQELLEVAHVLRNESGALGGRLAPGPGMCGGRGAPGSPMVIVLGLPAEAFYGRIGCSFAGKGLLCGSPQLI